MPRKPVKKKSETIRVMYPGHGRLIVRRREVKGITEGGIVIPDTAKEKAREGTVVAVGTLAKNTFQRGDLVAFLPFNGCDMIVEGQEYVCLEEEEVLCVLKTEVKTKENTPPAEETPIEPIRFREGAPAPAI